MGHPVPSESLDREVSSAFTDKDLVSGNLRLEADLDSSMRERNQLAGCIQNWTEELNRADIDEMGEDGPRNERRIANWTLRINDHKPKRLKEGAEMKSSEEEVVEDSTNPKDILEGEEVKEEVIEELDQCKQTF